MSNYYIPIKFKTGRSKRDSNVRAISCKNTKHGWVNNAYFTRLCGYTPIDNPRDAEVNVKRTVTNAVQTYDNVPTSGFKFSHVYSWRDSTCYMIDPRGWTFYTTINNYINLTKECNIVDGVITDPIVYCVDTDENRIRLVKVGSSKYEEAIKEEQVISLETKIKSSITKKDLCIGKIYRMFDSPDLTNSNYCRVVYLGQYKYSTDIKKLKDMIDNYNYDSWNRKAYNERGVRQREQIMAALDKPKFIFLRLTDMVSDKFSKYDKVKKCYVNGSNEWHNTKGKYHGIDAYLKIQGENFDLCFQGINRSENSSVVVMTSFNPLVVRSLDKDQRLIITDNWLDTTQSRFRTRVTRRRSVMTGCDYLTNDPIPDFHYREFRLEDLQKAVSFMFRKTFDMIKNPQDYK